MVVSLGWYPSCLSPQRRHLKGNIHDKYPVYNVYMGIDLLLRGPHHGPFSLVFYSKCQSPNKTGKCMISNPVPLQHHQKETNPSFQNCTSWCFSQDPRIWYVMYLPTFKLMLLDFMYIGRQIYLSSQWILGVAFGTKKNDASSARVKTTTVQQPGLDPPQALHINFSSLGHILGIGGIGHSAGQHGEALAALGIPLKSIVQWSLEAGKPFLKNQAGTVGSIFDIPKTQKTTTRRKWQNWFIEDNPAPVEISWKNCLNSSLTNGYISRYQLRNRRSLGSPSTVFVPRWNTAPWPPPWHPSLWRKTSGRSETPDKSRKKHTRWAPSLVM